MATVNKNFKVKNGLVVEGSTATVAGKQVLTEDTSDQYIINLIGGETLVTSVESTQMEVIDGELNIKSGVFDSYGSAADAESNANTFATGEADAAEAAAIAAAALDATSKANAAQSAAASDATTKAATAKSEAISAAASDATTKSNNALTSANSYTDGKIATEVTDRNSAITSAITNLNLANTYDAKGAAAQALVDSKAYTDQEVADLVGSAPALLDTLNELATAISNNPNYATDAANAVAGRVAKAGDTMTGALTLSGAPTVDLHAATKGYVDSAAATAQENAEGYADGLAGVVAGDLADHESATEAHGATGAVVGTTNTQTLTNKTIGDTLNFTGAGAMTINSDSHIVLTPAAGSSVKWGSDVLATQAYVDNQTTSDVAEGTNQYFTDARAKTSAADLLTGANLTNITITGTGAGLTITAENGVADSTTTDLAEGTNKYFTDARAISATAASYDVLGAAAAAQAAAEATASEDATTKANDARLAAEATAAADATSKVAAEAALRVSGDAASVSTAATDATSKANAAQSAAIAAAATDATTKANAAQSAAETFATNADTAVRTAVTTEIGTAISTEVTNRNSAIASAIATEVTDRNAAIGTAVSNLVDGAPALLNTLSELAEALGDQPDTISNLTTLVGTKAPLANPALTGVPTAPTAAADTNTTQIATTAFAKGEADAAQSAAALDATSKADAAQAAAISAAALDATSKADAAQAAAIAHADALDTDDVAEGANLYFTDARARSAVDGTNRSFTSVELNSVAKQVAATLSAPTAGVQTAYSWAKADFRSAEFLVRVGSGVNTEISKVLLTLDTSDNIAITEYGIVSTNNELSTVSAAISGSNVELKVTTLSNTSVITVMGTLIK